MVLSTVNDLIPSVDEVLSHVPAEYFKESLDETDNVTLIFELLLGQVFPFRGFILFDQTGQLLRSTTKAEEFCMLLQKGATGQVFKSFENQPPATLPEPITALCHCLVESRIDFPEYTLQLYDTVFLPGGIRLYLKAEWIELVDQPTKCMLVTIEDLTQIAHHRAVCDAYRYGLTCREAEVWERYLQGLSYREISQGLVISVNTVKKHMKSIFTKCDIECRCRHLA